MDIREAGMAKEDQEYMYTICYKVKLNTIKSITALMSQGRLVPGDAVRPECSAYRPGPPHPAAGPDRHPPFLRQHQREEAQPCLSGTDFLLCLWN
ncbi:hypothetical protein E2C01_048420 [Portunus trituberculatus]|uniref:Uncharacterized protein n=1 Tax=Portunus trituberculatus TaxID=210409 RepID=A0A5B7G3S2_PORTR|nr:hypothetical protein [Portunus trituberculatus]